MTAHALTRQVRTGGQTDGSRTYIANRGSSHIECITAIHPNSDAATVYQRRNIKKATKEDADGKKVTGWQREEREMSRDEYDRLTLMQEVVASNTTGIVESVTQFQKDAVIDEYTQQLIEEGLI